MSEDNVRQKLVKLVTSLVRSDLSFQDRMSHIVFVSKTDSFLYEESIERGEQGDKLRDLYMTEGLVWIHPLFMGHTVIWYTEESKVCSVDSLTKEEMLLVIGKQREYVKKLWDRRIVIS